MSHQDWVTSHMSHMCLWHVTYTTASCHTCVCVMSHILLSLALLQQRMYAFPSADAQPKICLGCNTTISHTSHTSHTSLCQALLRQLMNAFPSARALVIKSACMREFSNRVFVCNELLRPLASYMQQQWHFTLYICTPHNIHMPHYSPRVLLVNDSNTLGHGKEKKREGLTWKRTKHYNAQSTTTHKVLHHTKHHTQSTTTHKALQHTKHYNTQCTTTHNALQHTKYYNAQSTATHNALQHTKHYNTQCTTTHKALQRTKYC